MDSSRIPIQKLSNIQNSKEEVLEMTSQINSKCDIDYGEICYNYNQEKESDSKKLKATNSFLSEFKSNQNKTNLNGDVKSVGNKIEKGGKEKEEKEAL